MTWFGWTFIVLEALGTMIHVANNEMKPLIRVSVLIANVLLVLGTLLVGTGHL